jgi:hypothetical protein
MKKHELGLRLRGGATPEDPHLFRHRYQHHDEASNKLLYYQYEAKRHPHVVVLEDLGVQSCVAAPQADQPNTTALTLVVRDQEGAARLASGAVVLGHELGCVTRAPNGSLTRPWQSTLRERIVGQPVLTALPSQPGISATFLAVPAALNEVFEHAQLEYYHGYPDKLKATRSKRLASLASKGLEDGGARYNFASAERVLADARAVAVAERRQLVEAGAFKPSTQKKPAPTARNASYGRQLSHSEDCYSFCVWPVCPEVKNDSSSTSAVSTAIRRASIAPDPKWSAATASG